MRHVVPSLLLLLASPAADYTAKVVGVSDGDTLTVLRDGRTQVKIRLHGVDAPESAQPFGTRSKQSASDLAFGQVETIRERDHDRYGHTVAEVILSDGRSLNHEQVRRGMAWWYQRYSPRDRELERLETDARAAHRGLWSDPRPVPPWDWRKAPAGPAVPAGAVVGNRNSKVFPAPTCPSVGRMKPENRVASGSAEEAEKAGFSPRRSVALRQLWLNSRLGLNASPIQIVPPQRIARRSCLQCRCPE